MKSKPTLYSLPLLRIITNRRLSQRFALGAASELGRQISTDPKTPGGPGSCSTIAEEAVDQLQENEKLVAGTSR